MPLGSDKRPKCLALMPLKSVDKEYLDDFKTRFIIDVSLNIQS